MNKKSISIIAIAIPLLAGLVYILVNKFNQPSTDEINATSTAVYQTEISKYLTAMPTFTPQPLPTNTPEVSPTPTEIMPMYDMFTAEDALLIYERPKFDSDVIGNLDAGESAVWAEERKDYSHDPNWHWYHVQFADVEKNENELFDGYVAVLTEQGKQMTQQTCPAVIADSFKYFGNYVLAPTGFVGGAWQDYAVLSSAGYTLGKISTVSYGGASIDTVNAVMVQLDPTTGLPVLVPYQQIVGIQFADENRYFYKMGMSGFPPEGECALGSKTCGLDRTGEIENYSTIFENRDEVISRIENKIVFVTFDNFGWLGTMFNYYDANTFSYIYDTSFSDSREDSIHQKAYRLFSQYEMETGDTMNQLFLRGKQVPQDWMNMQTGFIRYFIIPDFPAENGYEQIEALTQCLQAISSY